MRSDTNKNRGIRIYIELKWRNTNRFFAQHFVERCKV